jgi:hypothetical protein|tara:strand:- start:105 stop:377 length:273 start_codon:yes stop_codon:yes gene_type:complete
MDNTETKPNNEWKERELGALWLKEGKKGKYFYGKINGEECVVFKNKHRETDKHPNYIVYKSQPREDKPQPTAEAPVSTPVSESVSEEVPF